MNEKSEIPGAREILSQHRAERDYLGGLLLAELRRIMPWGHEFDLPNGARAKLVRMNSREDGSEPYRKPIYDPTNLSPAGGESSIVGYGAWQMVFDFKMTNCDQDHIEVTMKITGGGGAV